MRHQSQGARHRRWRNALAVTVALLLLGTAMWRHFDPTEPHVSTTQVGALRSYTVTGVASGEALKLPEEPTQERPLVDQIPHNANCVTGTGKEHMLFVGTWVKERHQAIDGWLSECYLSPPAGATSSPQLRTLSGSLHGEVNLRAKPVPDSKLQLTLKVGQRVASLEQRNRPEHNWIQPPWDDGVGWVNSKFLTENSGCK